MRNSLGNRIGGQSTTLGSYACIFWRKWTRVGFLFRPSFLLFSFVLAAFFLASRHVQGTYRDIYSSRYRLVRKNAAIRASYSSR